VSISITWHCEAERLRGLQINDQLKFRCLIDWQFARLFAFEDTVNVAGRAPIYISRAHPISDEPALFSEKTVRKKRGQKTLLSQLDNKPTVGAVF
jgi:hypothetical protein